MQYICSKTGDEVYTALVFLLFNGNVFTHLFHWFFVVYLFANTWRGPTKIPFVKGISHWNKKPFDTKIKVNTCTNFVLGRLKKKEEKSCFCNFMYVIVVVYFTTFESYHV